ncbi:MAG: tetratricopeptide repeat protein [Spirochaetaceae bacterium]|jgi:tetratricopeptide (TPR) repeat protein|nr:tetratricopeptide repeat protein [Spirochaetaceae bacterium]
MPSLEQLNEFKSSFKDLGNEALTMANNQLFMEDVELPGGEPPLPFPEGLEGGPDSALDMPDLAGLNLDAPPESFSGPETPTGSAGFDAAPEPDFSAGGDFDFGDLLGGDAVESVLSQDLPDIPDIPDVPDVPEGGETFPAEGSEDLPEDLLSGFAEDLEDSFLAEPPGPAGELSVGEEEPAGTESVPAGDTDFSGFEFPDIDLSQAMDMGGEFREGEPAPAGAAPDAAEPEGFTEGFTEPEGFAEPEGFTEPDQPEGFTEPDQPGAEISGAADFDLGDIGDFGAPEAAADQGAEPDGMEGTGFDMADFGADPDAGFGFPESMDLGGESIEDAAPEPDETEAPPEEGDGSFSDLNIPDFEETGEAADEAGFPDTGLDVPAADTGFPGAGDPFDTFDLGGETWTPPPGETPDTPDFSAPPDDFGDFSLDGIDDTGTPGTGPSRTSPGRTAPAASENIEEIRLSEEEYNRLQDTLSSYPLNLRIACEELIAEQAVAPDLMSALIKLLTRGAPAKETAALAGRILGRAIPIPKGYAKQTGAELEAEQASFGYIFVHSFLPVLRLFGAIALVVLCLGYLIWRFVVTPLQAEDLYKKGYTALQSGEYARANELFLQGFEKRRVKNWFYRYAEGFRDERQYIYAERKYDELLRVFPRDKKGALDYAAMETYYRYNYEKADMILRTNILDYAVNDREGLMALAENNLAWGEVDPSRYEEARAAYARLLEKYGRTDSVLEGMLKYFIRTDQLDEVLPLQAYFMEKPKKRKISVPTLAELGGYLLDKKFTEVEGVPDEYVDRIEGIRDVLLRAVKADENYPEPYYHLARYYNRYGSTAEERQTLEKAVRIFDGAREETPKRAAYRVDAHRRYAEVLINAKEFFSAEEELIRGVRIYEDARARQVLKTQGEFGRLYADLGDLEFFVKEGDMAAALRFYQEAERNGWSPPEIQYRMGAAHYQNEAWEEALRYFFALTPFMPNNKRLLYALGNTAYMRGNYFAAQGYYNRLMDLLTAERVRFPNLAPGSRPDEQDLAERIMVADNNLGVTLETLTRISGDTGYRTRALGLFSESIRAWDVLTRDPETMSRMRPIKDLYGPGINLGYLNAQNILHPEPDYELQLFMRIDRDALEPSPWESLVPRDYQLSDQLLPMQVE